MQHVSRGGPHPHVMGVLDVLQDEEYLLLFMPFCSSGDLFGFVQQAGRFPEPMARFWFKQILEVGYITQSHFFLHESNSHLSLPSWFLLYLSGTVSFTTDGSLSQRHVPREHPS